jgi:hypothetical protein
MNSPDYRIPEDKAQEVFTLAAQLYAQHTQSYSVQELMEAGTEAKIPPEFVQQAIDQLQITHSQGSMPTPRTQRSKYLLGLAIALPLLAGILGAGWLVARNAAPVQQPISDEPPVAANPVTGSFKCANLNLAGQDFSGKNLSQSDCTKANLENANFSNSTLQSSNFSYAKLEKANLRGADLRGADLTGADLTGADLSGAKLKGANLSKTDLRGANLKDTNIGEADTAEAKLGANQK